MSKETELSDEQIDEVFQSHANDDPEMHLRFARAIVAADRELRRGDVSPTGKLIDDLKKASEQIALAGHAGWGNLCNEAQAALAAQAVEIVGLRKNAERFIYMSTAMLAPNSREAGFLSAEKSPETLEELRAIVDAGIAAIAAIAKETAK